MPEPVLNNLDLWTSALVSKSSAGRGSNGKQEAYGIKKLRRLILELAVRGKLVPQDPDDEPAGVFIGRVAAARARLATEDASIHEKPLAEVTDQDIPYPLPHSWQWARLPDIASYKVGKTPSTKNPDYWTEGETGVPWVSISDMEQFGVVTDTSKRVTSKAAKQVFGYEPIRKDSLLMSFKLTVGKTAVLGVHAYHNEAIISLQPYQGIAREYLLRALPLRAQEGNTKHAIKGHTLNSTSLSLLLLPIPPLAEQRRIVAKVDELMGLCDQLEQQQTISIEAHRTLVETLLSTLTRVVSPQEQSGAWAHIANNFEVLFNRGHSIDALKQTILQIAVMGKLVPQDPSDEPSSVQLETIGRRRAKLIASGEIRAPKDLEDVRDVEKRFPLPHGWEWIRVGKYLEVNRGASPRPKGDPRYFATTRTPYHWVKIGDLRLHGRNNVLCDTEEFLTEEGAEMSVLAPRGTLVITNSATIGIPIVMGIDGYIHDGFLSFPHFPTEFLSRDFFLLGLQSLSSHLMGEARGLAQLNMNSNIMRGASLAIPPLAEQHRIVAKVGELMGLCDALKARLGDAQMTQVHLADAIVEQAIA